MDVWGVFQARVDDAGVRCDVVAVSGSREDGGLDIEVGSICEFLLECLEKQ